MLTDVTPLTAEEQRRIDYASRKHIEGRARAMRAATPLTKCARCKLPLGRDLVDRPDQIEYDHDDDRGGYLGLSHAKCNRRAAGKKAGRLAAERAAYGPQGGTGGYVPVWEW